MIEMQRKVMRLGAHSYVISLPLGWVKYYKIKKGDKLQLLVNSKVVIKPLAKREKNG
jgi:uncharacterized membrane protein (UPF0127 family)